MTDTLITHLQIFGIGFSFGIAGPCFLVCTPILITYILGRRETWGKTIIDILVFLFGRLFAYIILGAIAGASGAALRHFTESNYGLYVKPLGGIVSILLGLAVLFRKEGAKPCACDRGYNKVYDFGSLLVLGFIIGASPCPPLLALLFEIALMSKSAMEGASYAISFGLGTFLSGLIVIGALAGLFRGVIQKAVRSRGMSVFFRVSCALLLILLGIGLIFGIFRT